MFVESKIDYWLFTINIQNMSDNTGMQTIYLSVLDYLNLRCLFWSILFPKAKKVEQGREESISVAALKGQWGTTHICASMPVPAVQGGKDTDCPEVISVTFDLQMLCAPLLPSHPYSLLLFFSQVTSPHSFAPSLRTPICYCKPPPLLLFFSQTRAAAPHSPHQPASFFLGAPPALEFFICWESYTSASRPASLGAFSIYLRSLLQLLPVSCSSCCPSPPCSHGYQQHRAPSCFQCLTYLLVADRKKSRDKFHLPKIHLDGTS